MEKLQKTRIFDLAMVLSVAFLPAIIKSLYLFAGPPMRYYSDQLDLTFFVGFVEHALGILLLFYVLYNRDKNYLHLGLDSSFRSILYGVLLAIVATAVTSLLWYIFRIVLPGAYASQLVVRNTSFLYDHLSWALLIYILINPFFEELIVRGFLMTELFSLSNSKTLAIAISVLIQTLYHLYQGLFSALTLAGVFLVFSIFYSRTGKLTPVIVAHLIADMAILLKMKH